jgi:dihydrofolate reductase
MPRPTCCVFIATSVDGFIARGDQTLDWLDVVQRKGEDYGYQRFFDSTDALVIGRKTYDFVRKLDAWPYGSKRCVVLTHRPVTPKANETFFAGTPRALLARLARAGVRRVYVDGGAVISQFLAAGLVDELTVSQVPVLLGEGIRLFQGGREQPLTLVRSRAFPSGLVQTSWRVAAKAKKRASRR